MTGAAFTGAMPPPELARLRAWLTWHYVPNGPKKPRKLPRYASGAARTGNHGSADDLAELVTFEQALAAARRRGDGVGLALTGAGISALDFDACVSESGQVEPAVQELVADTYAEVSPSGRGVRAFVLDPEGVLANRKSAAKGDAFGFETFSTTGFVTYTGKPLALNQVLGTDQVVAPIGSKLLAFFAQRFPAADPERAPDPLDFGATEGRLGLGLADMRRLLDALPNQDLAYEGDDGITWLGVGMALHHESGGSPEAFELWDDWSRESSKYSTREYGLQRWESFGRYSERPVTMATLRAQARKVGVVVGGGVEDFEVLGEELASAPADKPAAEQAAPVAAGEKPARFRVLPAAEFALRKPPGWIIKGVLPRAELVVLFGESGSGKSFVALDMAGAIARGVEWRGRRVAQGRVVYIAAEGAGGFRNRLVAYAQHLELELAELPLGVVHAAPNLLLKPEAIELAQSIGRADVVIVDTFAQTTPGANENAGEDMGMALRHCRGIHLATGATVVLVHHAGKDLAKGSRGWSGIKGAADAQLEVRKYKTGRVLSVEKQKDGEDGLEFGFALERVEIGRDEDGDPIDSCVVVEAEVVKAAPAAKVGARDKWTPWVMQALQELAQVQTAGIELAALTKDAMRISGEDYSGTKFSNHITQVRRTLRGLSSAEDAPLTFHEKPRKKGDGGEEIEGEQDGDDTVTLHMSSGLWRSDF